MLSIQNNRRKIAPSDINITIQIIGDVLADVHVTKRFLLPEDLKSATNFEFRETFETETVRILDVSVKSDDTVYKTMIKRKEKIESETSKQPQLSVTFTSSNVSGVFIFSLRFAIRIFQRHLILPQSFLRSTHRTIVNIDSISSRIQSINNLPSDTDVVVKDRKARISISRDVKSDAIVRIEASSKEEKDGTVCVAKYRNIALMKRISSEEYFQDCEVVLIATRAFARAYVVRVSESHKRTFTNSRSCDIIIDSFGTCQNKARTASTC